MRQVRSGREGFAIADLFGDVDAPGVGARQGEGARPGRGGGYLKICGSLNFRLPDADAAARAGVVVPVLEDPRFQELEAIGLPRAWLRLARRVGFDAFLDVWKDISEDESTRHDGGRRMPKLREFSAYQRFQRNRYVRELALLGASPQQIRKLVAKNLGEEISICHIQSIMRGKYLRRDVERAPAVEQGAGE